jgi:predicted amidohydrolase
VAGLVEEDAGNYYNTAILTGPEGFIGKYRKIHLNAADKKWATAGKKWATFDLPIGRVGLLIGYDTLFPESGRLLSLLGCDLILCPSRLKSTLVQEHEGTQIAQNYPIPTGADPYHWHFQRVRAGENNVYLAFANEYNPNTGCTGKSGIFGPDTFSFPRKETIIRDGEGIGCATIDTENLSTPYPTNVVRRKDLILMRQPHFYYDLIKNIGNDKCIVSKKQGIALQTLN